MEKTNLSEFEIKETIGQLMCNVEGDIVNEFDLEAFKIAVTVLEKSIPKPPVIMIKDGEAKVVVKRESYDDVLRNDIY